MSERSLLEKLEEINRRAAFNRWAGIVVTAAESGSVELTLAWREDLGQYNGFLHAGIIGALIDTSCGFAAVTTNEWVMASHFSVNCLAPARGETFVAKARILKAGRKQVFAAAELFANFEGRSALAAIGQTLLVPTRDSTPAAS